MKKAISTLTVIVFLLAWPTNVHAQESTVSESYVEAKILEIKTSGEQNLGETVNPYQILKAQILNGPDQNKIIEINHGQEFTIRAEELVKAGDKVILAVSGKNDSKNYRIFDRYRLDTMVTLTVLFIVLVLSINRLRGFGSLAGLGFSLLIITAFIVPQIIAGRDPLLISILGSLVIMTVSLFLAHGFNAQTTLAVLATFISLVITGLLAIISVKLTNLTGLGSEEAYSLRFGPTANLNFQGFLLGGIIIGALGVLDDITTTQVAAVKELWHTDKKLSLNSLFKKGFRIGREHITSLVNTLVLAYAGASLPLFIFLSLNPSHFPLWVILNSEMVSEEMVRSLAGSIGLVLSVPIATFLAAWYFHKKS